MMVVPRGKSDRDRVVVSSLLAVRGVSLGQSVESRRGVDMTYDLARVLRRFLLRRRTRFFLHLALIFDN